MPNQHSNSTLMRVDNDTYTKVKTIAEAERRPMNAQLAILVEEGMKAQGIQVDVSRAGGK